MKRKPEETDKLGSNKRVVAQKCDVKEGLMVGKERETEDER